MLWSRVSEWLSIYQYGIQQEGSGYTSDNFKRKSDMIRRTVVNIKWNLIFSTLFTYFYQIRSWVACALAIARASRRDKSSKQTSKHRNHPSPLPYSNFMVTTHERTHHRSQSSCDKSVQEGTSAFRLTDIRFRISKSRSAHFTRNVLGLLFGDSS